MKNHQKFIQKKTPTDKPLTRFKLAPTRPICNHLKVSLLKHNRPENIPRTSPHGSHRNLVNTSSIRNHTLKARPLLTPNSPPSPSDRSFPDSTDHPHSCGEYAPVVTRIDAAVGSSPPSRGIYAPCRGGFPRRGTIPALAGNTWGRRPRTRRAADHPRSRGEYPVEPSFVVALEGSSPLSRGIPGQHGIPGRIVRIIPALAGNTARRTNTLNPSTDHPRSRGEYTGPGGVVGDKEGSSPLSRGIHHPQGFDLAGGGIIPALAGNTHHCRAATSEPQDHPRSRGEYHIRCRNPIEGIGSSPLSRGIHRGRRRGRVLRGIIPALAGNTTAKRTLTTSGADHPRSRGEYAYASNRASSAAGSSPLSRGIRSPSPDYHHPSRIIPALAGNTNSRCLSKCSPPDHPRSRGEYLTAAENAMSAPGSSPLSRGIRNLRRLDQRPRGIIPALAGNTRSGVFSMGWTGDHPRSRGEYGCRRSGGWLLLGSSPLSRGILPGGFPRG